MFRFAQHDNGILGGLELISHSLSPSPRVFSRTACGKGAVAKQIPQRKRRIGFHSCLIVHTGDTRQLSLEMRDRARRRIVCIEITESPAQQPEQFWLAMIALGANLNQLNKIRGTLLRGNCCEFRRTDFSGRLL